MIWRVVATGGDLLLDMLVHLQETAPLKANWPEKDISASMKDIKCAASLTFDDRFDDVNFVDFLLVKRVVFYAIQMMYAEQR